MNYKNFNLGDWIGHISGVIEDETTLDGNEMRDLVEFLTSLKQELTTKNDLGVELINRVELLKDMDTWDKFGYTTRYGLERLDKDDKGFVPYVKYEDMVNCVKGMSSVTPQEPTIDYRRAFKIACELLSGSVLYGIDSDKIFETAMQKDGLVSNESYERYILNHLQELDHGQYAG